jgi:hypothetical protein
MRDTSQVESPGPSGSVIDLLRELADVAAPTAPPADLATMPGTAPAGPD